MKRENPEIFIENNEKCEYFLDTSLVMSLLRLSTIEHETYAKEMLEVIKSSGNIPRVHPITLREIKNILLSVESEQGPRSNTEIESAYERYNLNPAKLAQIRCNLNKKVEDLGISVFPNSSEHDLNLIINEYQNKSIVKKLHRLRSYTDELFRDIHDIFMNDYIDKRRLESKRCHFVTLNTELINFCNKDSQSRKSNLIHPGKIVLELWMHNTKSSTSTIKSSILVETISRCMLLNNKSVREKLEIVSHYYNDRTLDFDPETYKGIILGLFRRDKKLMENINEMSKNEVNKQSRKNDVIIRKIIEEGKRNIQEIKENHAIFQTQLAELTSDNLKMKNIQKSLEEKQEKLQQSLIQERDSKNNFSNENKNLKENIQKQDVLINLYKEKDDISKNISLIEQQISILENERGKFVSYRFFYFVYFVLIVSILIFIICVAIYLYGKINPNENIGISNTLNNFIGGGAVVVAVADIIFNLWKNESNIFMPHVFKANIRKKQLDAWEITHPKYVQLQMDLEELKKQLTSVKEEIRKNHI